MKLHELKAPKGSRKKVKRVGRGPGSGRGKTAARGHKGQGARAGGTKGRGFEGGQQPLIRQIPKRGFKNIFAEKPAVVNVGDLAKIKTGGGEEVTPEVLMASGLIRRAAKSVKILGQGEIKASLRVRAHQFSKSARGKIEAAGGQAMVIADV